MEFTPEAPTQALAQALAKALAQALPQALAQALAQALCVKPRFSLSPSRFSLVLPKVSPKIPLKVPSTLPLVCLQFSSIASSPPQAHFSLRQVRLKVFLKALLKVLLKAASNLPQGFSLSFSSNLPCIYFKFSHVHLKFSSSPPHASLK